jgi:hypothetical protein
MQATGSRETPRRANTRSILDFWRLALVLAVVAAGCTWSSRVPRGRPITLPENAPRRIERLNLCEPVHGVLDCQDRECNLWYRVDVLQPGRMRVQLEVGEAKGGGRLTRVVLRPLGKPILAQQVSNLGESIDIRHDVVPDVYALLVQGAGDKRSFDLLVSMAPSHTRSDTPSTAPGDGTGEPSGDANWDGACP